MLKHGIGQSQLIKLFDLARHDSPVNLILDNDTIYSFYRLDDGALGPVVQRITKLNEEGNEIWSLQLRHPQSNGNIFEGKAALLKNHSILYAYTYSSPSSLDHVLLRIHPDGSLDSLASISRWFTQDIEYLLYIYKIIEAANRDIFLFFGLTNSDVEPSQARNGYFIMDTSGVIRDTIFFDHQNEFRISHNIERFDDTTFLYAYQPHEGGLHVIRRCELIDLSGNTLWRFQIGPEDPIGPAYIAQDPNGNSYHTCIQDTSGQGGPQHSLPTVFSLDKNGQFRWSQSFGEIVGFKVFFDILYTDGTIIAA